MKIHVDDLLAEDEEYLYFAEGKVKKILATMENVAEEGYYIYFDEFAHENEENNQ